MPAMKPFSFAVKVRYSRHDRSKFKNRFRLVLSMVKFSATTIAFQIRHLSVEFPCL